MQPVTLLLDAQAADNTMVCWNIVIGISTAVMAAATILFWLATWKSIVIARDHFRAANRPYVIVAAISQAYAAMSDLSIIVTLSNVGSVIARNVGASLSYQTNANKTVPVATASNLTIPPGASFPLTAGVPAEQYEPIREGRGSLAIFIVLTYDGVEVERCHRYSEKRVFDHSALSWSIKELIAD